MKSKLMAMILLLLTYSMESRSQTDGISGNFFDKLLTLANAGDAKAMNGVGLYYLRGKTGGVSDPDAALKWFYKSAEKGYSTAWFNIGNMYRTGDGVDQDFQKAYSAYEKSISDTARLPNYVGYYSLGYLHYKGLGCVQNYSVGNRPTNRVLIDHLE